MKDNTLFICNCFSTEHQIIMFKDPNLDIEEDPVVYAHVHLIKRSIWYRIKYAFKYIFGYKSRFGAWDEFIFSSNHIKDLESVLNHLKSNTNGKKSSN